MFEFSSKNTRANLTKASMRFFVECATILNHAVKITWVP